MTSIDDYFRSIRLKEAFLRICGNRFPSFQHPSHQLNDSVVANDGSIIVSGGENGVITGWPGSPPQGGLLYSNGPIIISVQYSPDGRMLASGADDGRVELWAAERETMLLEIPAQMEQPDLFRLDFYAFSPDSSSFAVAHQDDDAFAVHLWDLVSMERTGSLAHPARVAAVAWSPDGNMVAAGCHDREGIRIWNLEESKVIKRLDEDKSIQCLAFSPDSRLLASKGWDNDGVMIWDLATGTHVTTLDEHIEPTGDVSSLRFSPDGRWLASAGYDRQVILWDTKSWTPSKRLLGHAWLVIDLSFSPDGKRLASSSPENWCRVWDIESGHQLARFRGLALDFSPDGNGLAVGGAYPSHGGLKAGADAETTVRIYRAPTFEAIRKRD